MNTPAPIKDTGIKADENPYPAENKAWKALLKLESDKPTPATGR